MTPNESPNFGPAPGEDDESARVRRKLLWRMGVAGLMIVALLGGLALFDFLASVPREPEYAPPRFTEPVPVPPKPATQALGPVVPAPEAEKDSDAPDTSVPEATAAPAIPADAPPADPAPSADAAAKPSPGRAAASPPSRTATAAPPVASPPAARAERRGTQGPVLPRPEAPRAEASRPEASRPLQTPRADAARTLPARQSPTLSRPLPGYTLQAGVFTDPRRAEEIHARLVQEGIPATLETRVLVGPFENRSEAESARAKMKALGIDTLLVPRGGRK